MNRNIILLNLHCVGWNKASSFLLERISESELVKVPDLTMDVFDRLRTVFDRTFKDVKLGVELSKKLMKS